MRRTIPAAFFAVFAMPALAAAADIPCGPVERDVIHVDGLLDEWGDVPGLDLGDGDRDFSLTARCNYDSDTLYLAVDVRDDYLVRSKAAKPSEDHLEIVFADGAKVDRLVVFPMEGSSPRKVRWSSGHPLRGVEVADSLQPRGWAVELRIALRSVPGFTPGVPAVKLAVGAWDCDSKSRPTVDATLSSSPLDDPRQLGVLEFGEARAALESFLRERRLRFQDISFDQMGRIFPGGNGRAIIAGKTLAVIGDEYAYLDLPVAGPKDILEVRLLDLAGDRREALVIRYREGGAGGSREVLATYRMAGEGLRRTFGVEVGKSQGPNRLETKILYVKRNKATDIVIEPLPATGWSESTYREAPEQDLVPILLPWGKEKRARFQFKGEEYVRAE